MIKPLIKKQYYNNSGNSRKRVPQNFAQQRSAVSGFQIKITGNFEKQSDLPKQVGENSDWLAQTERLRGFEISN